MWRSSPRGSTGDGGTSRAAHHEKLSGYETRRRQAYAKKFDTSSLYWKAFRDLLSASLQETGRAHRVVVGTSRANQQYADAMQAMYEDMYVDDKGNIAVNAKRQSKLLQNRSTPEERRTRAQDSFSARRSVLTSIRESQHVMSENFTEESKNMETEIASQVENLLKSFQVKADNLESLGNSILAELEKTEREVSNAWEENYNTENLNSAQGSDRNLGGSKPESAPKKGSTISDLWLLETQYRVAASYQNTAWERASEELSSLFERIKSEECRRRMDLREYLVAFVQRQQRLYAGIPGIQNPILEELAGRQLKTEDIQKIVQDSIEDRAAMYYGGQKPDVQPIPDSEDFSLESPLESELLFRKMIVEYKEIGVLLGKWRLCLAVVSSDSILHIFDLPSDRMTQEVSTEDAFQALTPQVIIPSRDNATQGKSNFDKGWGDQVTPSLSLVLAHCVITLQEGNILDIVETPTNTGTQKMFAKMNNRPKNIMIRASKAERLDEVIDALKSSPC